LLTACLLLCVYGLQLVQALQLQHLLQPNSAHLMFSRALVAEGCCVWLQQGPFNAKGKLTEFIKAAAAYVHIVEQELDVAGGWKYVFCRLELCIERALECVCVYKVVHW
jgi:hypothetical protein